MTGTNGVEPPPKKIHAISSFLLLRCCESAHFLLLYIPAPVRRGNGHTFQNQLIFGIERVLSQNLEICAQVSGETGLLCLYMFVSFATQEIISTTVIYQ